MTKMPWIDATTWILPEDFMYGTPAILKGCEHEVIDNGTRLSECRHCKVTMRLKGFEWSAE
jgi:putative NADPH-quinone reductase